MNETPPKTKRIIPLRIITKNDLVGSVAIISKVERHPYILSQKQLTQ